MQGSALIVLLTTPVTRVFLSPCASEVWTGTQPSLPSGHECRAHNQVSSRLISCHGTVRGVFWVDTIVTTNTGSRGTPTTDTSHHHQSPQTLWKLGLMMSTRSFNPFYKNDFCIQWIKWMIKLIFKRPLNHSWFVQRLKIKQGFY